MSQTGSLNPPRPRSDVLDRLASGLLSGFAIGLVLFVLVRLVA